MLSISYDSIAIKIPYNITTANLEVKVFAQLQEVTSPLNLNLKAPEIFTYNGAGVYWSISNSLILTGKNFNPQSEFGELTVNGINCYFSATADFIYVDLPPGPHADFEITEIVYTTGGLSYIHDSTIALFDDKIMVDYSDASFQHTLFVHNNLAFKFQYYENADSSLGNDYTLASFSSDTQVWTDLNAYSYTGRIDDVVYDGEDSVFIYKHALFSEAFYLSKLNLDTFEEENIEMPFINNVFNPILIPYQDNLYFLSGIIYYDGIPVTVANKYKYDSVAETWEELPSNFFVELPLIPSFPVGHGRITYLHHNESLYFYYGSGNGTYKLNPDLSIESINYLIYFEYNNDLFGFNYGDGNNLYNITTNTSRPAQYGFLGRNFFTLNNEIYFHQNSASSYFQNTQFTYKLSPEYLSDILD